MNCENETNQVLKSRVMAMHRILSDIHGFTFQFHDRPHVNVKWKCRSIEMNMKHGITEFLALRKICLMHESLPTEQFGSWMFWMSDSKTLLNTILN